LKYKKKYLSIKNQRGGAINQWFWHKARLWMPYDESTNEKIEAAYKNYLTNPKLDTVDIVSEYNYTINFSNMMQYRKKDPNLYRHVLRKMVEYPIPFHLTYDELLSFGSERHLTEEERAKGLLDPTTVSDTNNLFITEYLKNPLTPEVKRLNEIENKRIIDTENRISEMGKKCVKHIADNIESILPIDEIRKKIPEIKKPHWLCWELLPNDTWNDILRKIIREYTGAHFGDLNRLGSSLFYKTKIKKFDFIVLSRNIKLFLEFKILWYLIQNCSYDEDLVVWRGFKDSMTLSAEKKNIQKDTDLYNYLAENYRLPNKTAESPVELMRLFERYFNHKEEEFIPLIPENLRIFLKKGADMLEQLKAITKIEDTAAIDTMTNFVMKSYNAIGFPYPSIQNIVNEPGKTILFPGFTSTSLSRKRIEHPGSTYMYVDTLGKVSDCCLFKIIIPKGFPCLYIGGLLGKDEKEIILPPFTTFKVLETDGITVTLMPISKKEISIESFIEDIYIYTVMHVCEHVFLETEIRSIYQKEINELSRISS